MSNNPFAKFDLSGRVAVVTGGAGLLGEEFCRTLAAAGAKVAVLDLNHEGAKRVAGAIAREGGEAQPYGLDITDQDAARAVIERIRSQWGRIDVLVNSAALDPKVSAEGKVRSSGAFEDFPLETWQKALNVNLTGMFIITQAVARVMKTQNKGSIINICSTYGLVGPDQRIYQREGQPPQYKPVYYTVTKAAVLGFTRYLATYYAGTEIRVNALTPGGVYNNQDDEFVRAYSARTVLGRMARKDELDGAILFLASDASSYMTGANLIVDGGWTAW